MRTFAFRGTRTLVAIALAGSGLAVASSAAVAATPVFDLCAVPGTISLPGGGTPPVWGFTPGNDCSAAPAVPGTPLEVTEGDTVTINVTNALPADPDPLTGTDHVLSLEVDGVTLDPTSTPTAAVGDVATLKFIAGSAGSYVLRSAGDAGRQTAMGLYRALIVRPTTAGRAYDDAATAFGAEATLVLSQVDPVFNADPDNAPMTDYLATYWLINGASYPDTAPIAAAPGTVVLLRLLNAGYDNTSMALIGAHMHVIAKDAKLLTNPFDAAAETIPAGASEDVLVTVPAYAPPGPGGFPLFNRNLHVTNGTASSYAAPGGMLTFIQPTP